MGFPGRRVSRIIVSLSMTYARIIKPESAGIFRKSCRAQGQYKRDTLYYQPIFMHCYKVHKNIKYS